MNYYWSMPVRRILQLGDPSLRIVSTPVESAGEATPLLSDLRDTLHDFQQVHGFGRGISAVQIGDARRVIYLEFEGQPYSLINPELVWHSTATFRLWDDCFSFPGLLVYLERWYAVRVRYLDETTKQRELAAEGSLSELLQHEIDHLDGILAVDHAIDRNSLCTRDEYERRKAIPCGTGAGIPQ